MVTLPFHPLEVRESEHRVYRLFTIDLATHHIPAFTRPKLNNTGGYDYPLRDALGLSELDDSQVQILRLSELGELGLTGYLIEGLGISEADLEANAERLDALEGHVAVLPSRAFSGPALIVPTPPVALVGAYAEHEAATDFTTLTSAAAKPAPQPDPVAPPPVPRAATPLWYWIVGVVSALIILYTLFVIFFSGGAS
ncbi:hypothetical protein C8N43_3742 [Litoreibacter ponti]|uniref:Uncharacterized protein n=1 Tax=Litoreibacter ponti TaxID=1510457 RepID=A0A2T6BFU1_9RHOB|nr:hypothetical protein [Litoreibacter ponti]PTX54919.1 hypothetical protein C8N43_3742 [Litoreibacter ponti]